MSISVQHRWLDCLFPTQTGTRRGWCHQLLHSLGKVLDFNFLTRALEFLACLELKVSDYFFAQCLDGHRDSDDSDSPHTRCLVFESSFRLLGDLNMHPLHFFKRSSEYHQCHA